MLNVKYLKKGERDTMLEAKYVRYETTHGLSIDTWDDGTDCTVMNPNCPFTLSVK